MRHTELGWRDLKSRNVVKRRQAGWSVVTTAPIVEQYHVAADWSLRADDVMLTWCPGPVQYDGYLGYDGGGV